MAAPGSSRTTCAASTDRNQSSDKYANLLEILSTASAHLSSLPRLHWQDVNAVSQAILADLRTPAASTDKQGDAPSNLMQSIVGTDIASNGTSDSPVQPPTPSAPQSQLHVSRPSWLQPVIALCLQVRQAYQRRQQRQAFPQHAISNMASMASTVAQPHPVPGPALISGAPARSDFSLPPRNLGTVGARVEAAPKLLATGLNTLTATAEMPVSGSEGAVRLAAHAAHTDDRIQKKPTLDPNLELWLRTQSRLQPPVQRHQPQVQQQFSRCVRVKRAYPISPTTSVAWDKQHLQQHLPINRVANLAGRQNSEPLSQLSTAQVAGIYAAAKAAAKAAATARTAATRQNMQVAGQQQPQVPQQQEQHLSCMPMQLQPQQQQTYSGARRRLFF
ncbi:hypothetical protein Vretimale_1536 [Volvox reticuliferus]|uniref:Uncharacterized protein n=1 Tax=Volvox reticuliferus TaxID=1737510 RepID=A0A8J4G226_9CHLO|nr:hypothetical protein Vretimale_1536 [Volvox reticuliferus]